MQRLLWERLSDRERAAFIVGGLAGLKAARKYRGNWLVLRRKDANAEPECWIWRTMDKARQCYTAGASQFVWHGTYRLVKKLTEVEIPAEMPEAFLRIRLSKFAEI